MPTDSDKKIDQHVQDIEASAAIAAEQHMWLWNGDGKPSDPDPAPLVDFASP
jgi:hypothetical protein